MQAEGVTLVNHRGCGFDARLPFHQDQARTNRNAATNASEPTVANM